MSTNKRIGIALSGGGYRAAAFHLGTLRKLNELNILPRVDIMSTISGGSIIGAYYCIHHDNFDTFDKKLRFDLSNKSVIREIILSFTFLKVIGFVMIFLIGSILVLFTQLAWLSPLLIILLIAIFLKYQFKIFPISKVIEKVYDRFFYENKFLKDLKDKPELAIGSTNLQTGRPFTFSKRKMDDSAYSYPQDSSKPIRFKQENYPIARAVMASSCVPFAFSPITIDKSFYKNPQDFSKINPQLIDGGVYDNQGMHKITQSGSSYECDIIITSDAGNKLPFERFYNNTLILLIRTMDVFMNRIKSFQMVKNIYENVNTVKKQIAYLSLGWNLEECIPGFLNNIKNNNITEEVLNAHGIKKEWADNPKKYWDVLIIHLKNNTDYEKIKIKTLTEDELHIARNVSTNLSKLTKKQVDFLIRQAENLTELQVKLYCPSLI